PFTGRSSQEVLAAHMTQRPEPLCARRPACPPGLEAVIMRCLEKRPADRWQSADELLAQLEPLATPSGGTTPTTTRPPEAVTLPPRSPRWRTAAVVLLALAAALALVLMRGEPEVRLGRRLQLTLSPGLELDPALSPDGKLVAFVAGPLFATRLYVRQVDGGTPVAITPENRGFARMPRWSPDGQRLVFSSNRGIEVIPALGGVPRVLVELPPNGWLDGAWSPDGQSIMYASGDSVLIRPVDGGASLRVTRLAEAHSCTWSPDGRWIACVSGNRQFVRNEAFGNIAASSVWVIPGAGGAPVRVTDDQSHNTSPAWLPRPVSLLYVSNREGGRDIYQVALTASGRPAHEAIRLTTGLNAATVSASADGRHLAYATFRRTSNVWSLPIPGSGSVNVSQAEPVTTGSQEIEAFEISADGRWLVFDADRSGTQQLYRMPLAGGEVEQLTHGADPALAPALSPDGRELAYHGFRDGIRQIFVMPSEGGTPVQVTRGTAHYRIAQWSPDGRSLTVVKDALTPAQETDILRRDPKGDWDSPRTILKGGLTAVWAPDGRRVLTLMKADAGRLALVIVPIGGGAPQVVVPPQEVSHAPGYGWDWCCAWSADGRFVYYIAKDQEDRKTGIWGVSAAGGAPRLMVWVDDPSRGLNRSWFKVRGNRFYFTLGDPQSDIWMMDVVGSRCLARRML
ncbi:MAG: hypothetical protein ACAI18_18465, partial [Gemmatimonadales bacterium]